MIAEACGEQEPLGGGQKVTHTDSCSSLKLCGEGPHYAASPPPCFHTGTFLLPAMEGQHRQPDAPQRRWEGRAEGLQSDPLSRKDFTRLLETLGEVVSSRRDDARQG